MILVDCLDDEASWESLGEDKLVVSWFWLGMVREFDKSFVVDACEVGLCGSLAPRVWVVSCKIEMASLVIRGVNLFWHEMLVIHGL